MTRSFHRDMTALEDLFEFLKHCLTAYHADKASSSAVMLAVEELFTNMIRHTPGGRHPISITIAKENNSLAVTMVDSDVEPFDVAHAPDADTSLPLNQRRIGGLGIHLVKHMVENLSYSYSDRRSVITFSKTLET
jgi:anti-sigma regulatory factor (Ser/Thr protein kinase)